jgi:hypothetical protein
VTPVVAWTAPVAITYGTALTSAQLNATANVAGSFAYTPAAGAVLNAGSQTLSVTFTPTDGTNYTVATASTALTVNKATPTINWLAPAAITYGTALSGTQLNATATVPGNFVYAPAVGAVPGAGTQTLSTTFTPTDVANYTTASASTTLTVNKATATLVLADLNQVYDGTPRSIVVTTTPVNLQVDVTYAGAITPPTAPGGYAVVATVNDANYTGSVTGTLTISAAALVNHAPAINGGLDGSIQMFAAENVSLNGSSWISGDLLVPGTPTVQMNGHPTYGSTVDGTGDAVPANYAVTLSGSAVLRHVVRRTNAIVLPVVPTPAVPTGTRDVVLSNANQSAGDFATIRSLTLNGNAGAIAVLAGTYGTLTANGNSSFVLGETGAASPSVYNLQGLALNGTSRVQIVGPVIINLASGISIGGSVGAAGHSEWLTLNVATGGITINGGVTFNGSVVAPIGTITVNGTLNGTTVSDRLVINSSGLVDQP